MTKSLQGAVAEQGKGMEVRVAQTSVLPLHLPPPAVVPTPTLSGPQCLWLQKGTITFYPEKKTVL